MKVNVSTVLIAIVVALVVASLSLFTVDQRQNAIVFRLGEIVSVKTVPGLFFKMPLVDNVRYFDARILTLDAEEAQKFVTSENKPVLVDSFVKWRIIDVRQYYVSVQGDEGLARVRLTQAVNGSLREEFGKRTIHDVVSGEREQIMDLMRERADQIAREIGVQVLDVRLKRVDFTPEVSESVYGRMQAERKRVANELRSTGFAEAEKIRADADKQRQVVIAQAYRDAQRLKGDGDAKASAIYARAFERNPEFYAFYRSLEAYRQSFKNKGDLLILEPNSEFFKYLKNPAGRAK
ncbi:MAG: protease modulator HflC [Betaproteobacteria bacterium]|nr:protease modulator HflC [Betaproteobacteria bacterium]